MTRWHEIDWIQREKDEAKLEKRRRIAETFLPLSDLTPIIPFTDIKNMDKLDGVRDKIRGRENSRKFRNTLWNSVVEEEILARIGITTVGVQIYPGEFAGAVNHGEIHEGIAVASGIMNIETTQNGETVKHREVGPVNYLQLLDPKTKLEIGISRYYGQELTILRVLLGDGTTHYQEFVELREGEHRTAKALGQEDPVVTVIYKQPITES